MPALIRWQDPGGASIEQLPVSKCSNCGGVVYGHLACEMMEYAMTTLKQHWNPGFHVKDTQ